MAQFFHVLFQFLPCIHQFNSRIDVLRATVSSKNTHCPVEVVKNIRFVGKKKYLPIFRSIVDECKHISTPIERFRSYSTTEIRMEELANSVFSSVFDLAISSSMRFTQAAAHSGQRCPLQACDSSDSISFHHVANPPDVYYQLFLPQLQISHRQICLSLKSTNDRTFLSVLLLSFVPVASVVPSFQNVTDF